MTSRRWKYVVAALAITVLTAGVPVVSHAKGKKRVVTATVDGKKVKWSGRYLSFNYDSGALFIVGTKVGAKKTIGIGCVIFIDTQTYPVTLTNLCSGQYAEKRQTRYWFNTGNSGVPFSVTFNSFDGRVIQGTFSGTLPPLTGVTSAVQIEGTFSGPINGR